MQSASRQLRSIFFAAVSEGESQCNHENFPYAESESRMVYSSNRLMEWYQSVLEMALWKSGSCRFSGFSRKS